MSRPELVKVNNFLHDAQGFSGLDSVWLVNDQGFCVASSNANDETSFIGFDMSGRGYVARALLGGFIEMYGVGRLSGEPGIFIAAPVYDDDGFLVGAVIAKVSIDRLRHWVSRAGTFVTDENGVVVMAHDGRLEYEAMPNAPVAKMTVQRAGRPLSARGVSRSAGRAHRRADPRDGAVAAARARRHVLRRQRQRRCPPSTTNARASTRGFRRISSIRSRAGRTSPAIIAATASSCS